MSKMRITATAKRPDSVHIVTPIVLASDSFLGEWAKKTGPTCSGVELGCRRKKRLATTNTRIGPRGMIIPIGACKCPFGTLFAGNPKRFGRKDCFPLFLGLDHFVRHFEPPSSNFPISRKYFRRHTPIHSQRIYRNSPSSMIFNLGKALSETVASYRPSLAQIWTASFAKGAGSNLSSSRLVANLPVFPR